MELRTQVRERLAEFRNALPSILRVAGISLAALGTWLVVKTFSYSSDQLRTIMESKPYWITDFFLWFRLPPGFRTAGAMGILAGVVLILTSVICRRPTNRS